MPIIALIVYNIDMPNDLVTINALVFELNSLISGGRIEKISQPEKDELLLTIRANQANHLLVISVNPNNPRMHLTNTKKDNPYTAFAFLMHLRRHIQGAKIERISLPTEDRLICFELCGRSELKDEVKYLLYVEMMGRYSNIILTDNEGFITDALRHFPPSEKERCILPRAKYVFPHNAKISPFNYEKIYEKLKQMTGTALFDFATAHIGGMAASTLSELIYRSKLSPNITAIFDSEAKIFIRNLKKIMTIAENKNLFLPCLAKGENSYEDYFVFPYTYSGKSYLACNSLNEAIEIYSKQKDKTEKIAQKKKIIHTPLNREIQKTMRFINHAFIKLEESKNADIYRIYGDLITCNLHQIKKGQEKIKLYNFYEHKEIELILNPLKNPAENAQYYFKKYNKLKRTFEIVNLQLKEHQDLLEYLLSIKQSLLMAEELVDLGEIHKELEKNGILKKNTKQQKSKNEPTQISAIKYDILGFSVLRGKNNIQNEKLTFKTAKNEDIWLHAKDGHGAHVIIKSDNSAIPEDVIIKAAQIAGYYSEFRNSGKAIIDYTLRKHVKKHPNNKSGMVIYSMHKSIIVSPSENAEYIISN